MSYHYKVMRMAKIKSPKLQVEQCELPNSAGSSVNWKTIFIIKRKMYIPYNPIIPLLGICFRYNLLHV